jgi:hypothetical protein
MMRIIKKILLFIVAIIAIMLVVALFVKKDYAISKEIVVNKPKQQVFEYISKLKNQNEYGTWYKMDTAMKQTFTGTDGMKGFISSWESDKAGNGSQTITNVVNGEKIETDLVFKSFVDFKSSAVMSTSSVNDSTTKVVWSMSGKTPYPFNVMSLFMSMEDAVGKDYSTGLANLKTILEK